MSDPKDADNGWLPIETAPEGVPIDVWHSRGKCRVACVTLRNGVWADPYWGAIHEAHHFTHWRPLPPPPQGDVG